MGTISPAGPLGPTTPSLWGEAVGTAGLEQDFMEGPRGKQLLWRGDGVRAARVGGKSQTSTSRF